MSCSLPLAMHWLFQATIASFLCFFSLPVLRLDLGAIWKLCFLCLWILPSFSSLHSSGTWIETERTRVLHLRKVSGRTARRSTVCTLGAWKVGLTLMSPSERIWTLGIFAFARVQIACCCERTHSEQQVWSSLQYFVVQCCVQLSSCWWWKTQ